jgi:benzoyl-CoA reductase/2-hydroxyglutaryl-CoA dehydratase subunit BcrC/BadD/HgdB
MEDVFSPRIRVIFDRLCAGTWKDLDLIVIPRTSEQEHKLFLYLREAAREHFSDKIPRLYFYDLLHTRTPESFSYGLERTRQMIRDFDVSDQALQNAIEENNRARRAVRAIQRKRDGGFLEGSAAFDLLRGFYREDRAGYADRLPAQLETSCSRVPTHRPRILIKGAPLECGEVYRLIEQAGGYVVAEDDWRGSRAAGDRDVRADQDPGRAIFEKYFYDETSPRVPSSERDAWFQVAVKSMHADGVVFFIPYEDDVAGWDYPRQSRWLEERSVPQTLIRDTGDAATVAALIEELSGR